MALVLFVLPACPAPDRAPDDRQAVVTPTPTPTPTPRPTRAERFERALQRCREERRTYAADRFVPPVSRRGDVLLPVVFPDGSTAELVYPAELGLHRFGVQPAVSLGVRVRGKYHERFLMITKTDIGEIARTDEIVESYEGPLGSVRVYPPKSRKELLNHLLVHHRVGSWNVVVGDGNAQNFMGKKVRRLWAESLDGFGTRNGWVVLEPRPPLAFADPGHPGLLFHSCFRSIELRLERCEDLDAAGVGRGQYAETVRGTTVHRHEKGNKVYASWCTPSRRMSVYMSDFDKRYVDLAVRGLRVRAVSARAGNR